MYKPIAFFMFNMISQLLEKTKEYGTASINFN